MVIRGYIKSKPQDFMYPDHRITRVGWGFIHPTHLPPSLFFISPPPPRPPSLKGGGKGEWLGMLSFKLTKQLKGGEPGGSLT
jgi:hypothetical protein